VRRKTRPRVVWLPNTNANSVGAFGRSVVQRFVVDGVGQTAPGTVIVGEVPIVIDSQDDPLDPATSLSDIENSGYRLRRIVGKIAVVADQTSDTGEPHIWVTAGLIIRRSNPETGDSFAIATANELLIDPQGIQNIGDPWIWRRNWMLFNNTTIEAQGVGSGPGPTSNLEYGSVADGWHVDAKTARIVSSEERLFLDVSIMLVTGGSDGGPNSCNVSVLADLRCLASMRTSSGNRRNASR